MLLKNGLYLQSKPGMDARDFEFVEKVLYSVQWYIVKMAFFVIIKFSAVLLRPKPGMDARDFEFLVKVLYCVKWYILKTLSSSSHRSSNMEISRADIILGLKINNFHRKKYLYKISQKKISIRYWWKPMLSSF